MANSDSFNYQNATDSTYEDEIASAEHDYDLAERDWIENVMDEFESPASQSIPVSQPREPLTTSWQEDPPIKESTWKIERKWVFQLNTLCLELVKCRLRAYVELITRLEVPRSLAVRELGQYLRTTLNDIFERKWDPQINWMLNVIADDPWTAAAWKYVQVDAREFTGKLELQHIWSGSQSKVDDPQQSDSLPPTADAQAINRPVVDKKRPRGRPAEIDDALKEQAIAMQANGGTNRDMAKILYREPYPTAQQVKNAPNILKHYRKSKPRPNNS